MKSKLISKIFIIATVVSISSLFLNANTSKATTIANEQETTVTLEEIMETEDTIMEYDARTNTTREVDMEALKQSLNNENELQGELSTTADYSTSKIIKKYTEPSVSLLSQSAQRVTNTNSFPYSATCRIEAINSKGSKCYGTAALVGANLALTSAHCVFDHNDNNYVYRNWTVYPGYNNGSYIGGKTGWDKVYYSKDWAETHDTGKDWAICVLQANLGNSAGYYEAVTYGSNSELVGTSVTLLGYPGDTDYGYTYDARYQYKSTGSIKSTNNTYFTYSSYSCDGFSGGPVFRSDNYIVGVNHGHVGSNSYGTRVTQEMVNLIRSLR